ncbi:hypothetical protein KFK09_010174 [Dendrobium nobile]|uniref:SRCR domain-containing protein n=1 Tax=Dendrobium nobile TaxID=94219 RepID=A0A8T3BJV4_DENNO|nr:hypothetical protein KFK09_010174 [Dendrobium nobile]
MFLLIPPGFIKTRLISSDFQTLPQKISGLLDDFFHGDSSGEKLHILFWNDTCKTRWFAGLGVPTIPALCHGFGCSLIWCIINGNNLLYYGLKLKYKSPWKHPHDRASIY